MIPDPPTLDFGPPRLREWAKGVADSIIKSRITSVLGGDLDERDFGQTLTIAPSKGSADGYFPWRLQGYVRNNQGYLSVDYAEVNQVQFADLPEGGSYEFEADEDGVVYAAIVFDSQSLDVQSWWPSLAQNDEEIPEDTDDGTIITINVLIGRFYIADDGVTPVPYNIERENFNITLYPAIAEDGRLVLEMFKTYTRAPLARDSFKLHVFNSGDLNKSALFVRVGDDDPATNDKLLFSAGGNQWQARWFTNPELWMKAASDGLQTLINPWHLELGSDDTGATKVWLGRGSDSTWHLAIPTADAYVQLGASSEVFLGHGSDSTWHLQLPNEGYVSIGASNEVWLGYGDGGYHLELPDAGWISLGALNIGSDNITWDGEDALNLYKAGLDVGDASINAYGFYIGDTKLMDGDLDLGPSGSINTQSIDASGTVSCSILGADSIDCGGGGDFDGNVNVAGNLDASSISTDSLTIGGTDFTTAVQNIVKAMPGTVNIIAACDGSGGASGSGPVNWS